MRLVPVYLLLVPVVLSQTVPGPPLKIHVQFMNTTFNINTQNIIRETIGYVSKLFSLRYEQPNKRFTLVRENMFGLSLYNRNTRRRNHPFGNEEVMCGDVVIPDEHLAKSVTDRQNRTSTNGFSFTQSNSERQNETNANGAGFTDGTNYILYVSQSASPECHRILAYAQVCRTDRGIIGGVRSRRPIAGNINFCSLDNVSALTLLRRVVVHEVLHLLGFNTKSITEFIECEYDDEIQSSPESLALDSLFCWKLRKLLKVNEGGDLVIWSTHLEEIVENIKSSIEESNCSCNKSTRILEESVENVVSSFDEGNCSCMDTGRIPIYFDESNCRCISTDTNSTHFHLTCCGVGISENFFTMISDAGGIALAKSQSGVHWPHDIFSQPVSVMVPGKLATGSIVIDPLTLAMMKTSGWYNVHKQAVPCLNYFLNNDSTSKQIASCLNCFLNTTSTSTLPNCLDQLSQGEEQDSGSRDIYNSKEDISIEHRENYTSPASDDECTGVKNGSTFTNAQETTPSSLNKTSSVTMESKNSTIKISESVPSQSVNNAGSSLQNKSLRYIYLLGLSHLLIVATKYIYFKVCRGVGSWQRSLNASSSSVRSLHASSPSVLSSQASQTQLKDALTESADEPISALDQAIRTTLRHPDYFQLADLFTVEDLFRARVHLGHTEGSLDPHMNQFIFGSRLGQLVIDLDQTAGHMRQALNFTAHIALRGGIIMFVGRMPQHQYLIEKTAMECGEYSHCRWWQGGVLTNSTIQFRSVTRLPDLIIILNTMYTAVQPHWAIRDAAKMLIPTVAVVDTNCNPNLITYPVPGNDDSQASVALYCSLFKSAILRGKEKRKELLGLKDDGSGE